MAKYTIYTADAFTSAPFKGNPAAIVPVPTSAPLTEEQMQAIAAEMNLPETAYIVPKDYTGTGDPFKHASRFGLRWFTPTYEAKLCGHATLATAHILFAQLHNESNILYFDTLSGELTVRKTDGGYLEMVFPIDAPIPVEVNDDIRLLASSVYGEYTETTQVSISPSLRYMLIHDPNRTEEEIERLTPEFYPDAIAAGKRQDIVVIIVTAKSSSKDFKSRVFDPWCGILEDPVTGSAHTVLAPFWADKLGKKSFSAQQCSQRSGDLEISIISDTHVAVSGRAVTVIEGTINV